MLTTYPLELWTIHSYIDHGYTASVWCPCTGWLTPPNLPALAADGYGEKPLRDLGLACPRCRQPVGLTICPTPGFGNR
jgi:hypothetical protein